MVKLTQNNQTSQRNIYKKKNVYVGLNRIEIGRHGDREDKLNKNGGLKCNILHPSSVNMSHKDKYTYWNLDYFVWKR